LKNDKDLIAGIIGVVATIACEIVLQILVSLELAKYSEYGLSSLLITGNRPSLILGFFVSSVVGGLISILLYQGFRKLGSEHLIIKCLGASISAWVALEYITTIYFEGKLIPIRSMSGYYCHLIGAFVFGITEGILFKRYLFPKQIIEESIESNHMEQTPQVDEEVLDTENIEDKNIVNKHSNDKSVYDIDKLLK